MFENKLLLSNYFYGPEGVTKNLHFYLSITDSHAIFIQLKSVNWSSDETPSPVKWNVRTTQFPD